MQEVFAPLLNALPTRDELLPLRDLPPFFATLQAAGVIVAVATSDDRTPTIHGLSLLGVAEMVSAWACGDDPLPKKPAPEIVRHLAATCGVPLRLRRPPVQRRVDQQVRGREIAAGGAGNHR